MNCHDHAGIREDSFPCVNDNMHSDHSRTYAADTFPASFMMLVIVLTAEALVRSSEMRSCDRIGYFPIDAS